MTAPQGRGAGGAAEGKPPREHTSPWRPFQVRAFAVIWSASLVSNTGTWLQQMGAAWLMTTLQPSPLLVALVQSATLVPVFLFALAAGALADIVNRRMLLLVVQSAMAVVAVGLGVVVHLGQITPWTLLAFTFALGMGQAFSGPAWQAVVPHLVSKEDLPAAVALNSAGFNVSRAIGPALGGVLISAGGIALPFLLNGVSFLAVVAAFLWWKGAQRPPTHLPSERLLAAMRGGVRYARESAPLRATLIRAVAFFAFATAFWALMPLIVRNELGGGPKQFGLVLACIGGGAVIGAFFLTGARDRLGADRTVALGTLATAAAIAVFALVPALTAVAAAAVLAGAAWMAVVASLNVSAQLSVPDWIRGRGLALFQTAMFGSMGIGSVVWGRVAQGGGLSTALLIAAGGLLVAVALTWRWRLQTGADLDLSPGAAWPEPLVAAPIAHDRGPVLVTVEYRIDPADALAFVEAMQRLRASRRRGGAYTWGLFEDAAQPGNYIETFEVESWLEHLRQHERITADDRKLQARAARFHRGGDRPRVNHHLAPPREPHPYNGPPERAQAGQ